MLKVGLSELTAFVAIADQRSFRAAARTLGVSPSALSHAIRGLEARMALRLFNRTTRSVALTEAGEQLLLRVRPAMADLEDAVNEAASTGDRPSGSIRISSSESGAAPLVRHVLPAFLAAYPDIHVEFVVDTRLVDIVADGFDAGIRIHEAVPRDMVAVRYGPDLRFVLVASPDYLSVHGTPKSPPDLAEHRGIRFRFDSGALYRWELQQQGKNLSIDVDGQITLGSVHLVIDAALAGIGVAWVLESEVSEHLASGRLVLLLLEWSATFPGLSLYYPANRHPPAALRLFVEAVRDWARSSA